MASPEADDSVKQPAIDSAGGTTTSEPPDTARRFRDISVRGRELRIYEHSSLMDPQTGRALTGAWVWDCAIAVAKWFETQSWPPGSFKGKRVIEVGAGTGLVGLALASLGADVVLTDREALMPGLRTNIQANQLEERCRADVLEWGSDASHLFPPVDYVVGSDILYDMSLVPALCKTLLDLSGPNTQIIIGYELRFGTTEAFQIMREHGLVSVKVDYDKLHPEWRSDDIGIFIIRRGEASPASRKSTSEDEMPNYNDLNVLSKT
ncbi:hypothetical protein KFL_005500060 [Klebsormidium nitens]|uniref:Uncharacterized protein n=1 Tax=Klebsormidium nitens TaxID=105231 RepID=A0A1Y1IGA6_KLENI|nr:hypothetical protein KFL_005500060 [Klebsormidium nitens]|eukprot:GAQ89683.1 hypothetical protein KFL_005500060 [Klebsormidium nitens]